MTISESVLWRCRGGATLAFAFWLVPWAVARAQVVRPTNDLPNPYRTVEGWAKMPPGRSWGATSAVDIDRDGVSVWVAERCGQNSCLGSDLPPVLKFDSAGNLVAAFGAGLLVFPHGIFVDHEGNVWVTDGQDNRPRRGRGQAPDAPLPPEPERIIGHQVFKFSSRGELLLTLGTPGGARAPGYFWQPNDVLVTRSGDIFVAEGHSSDSGATARILKFDRAGRLVKEWGRKGSGPGEFDQPHALAMDSQGRLFVGDRGNNRIQIFDQEGKLLDIWYQFSRPSGLFIDGNDIIYVADSESGSVGSARTRSDWKRGIRIGSARDGRVLAFIPDPVENATNTSAAEGVAVDRNGVIYGAEVGSRSLKRYVRN